MHRYKVFRHGGQVVVGRYGERTAIPCGPGLEGLALAFRIIDDMQQGIVYCEYEMLARVPLAKPLVPSPTQLRLRAGVAA